MAQQQQVIEALSDLTVSFLKTALEQPNLESFTTTRVGTGQMAECHRIQLSYSSSPTSTSSPSSLSPPRTAILKIASQDPRSRATARSIGIYEQEVRFYRDLGTPLREKLSLLLLSGGGERSPPVPVPVGKCYHAAFNRETGGFTLLLEDSGTEQGDDIKGATKNQAYAAMRALGRMQGCCCMSAELEKGERGATAAAAAAAVDTKWLIKEKPLLSPEMFRHLFTSFEERYKGKLTPAHFEVCERIVGSYAGYAELLEKGRPGPGPGPGGEEGEDEEEEGIKRGVIHGDYRLDNMLFRRNGDELDVVVVDWQCVTAGHLLGDVAYFLGGSLLPRDRREWQDELLVEYCRGLEEGGGGGGSGGDGGSPAPPLLTLEQCRKDLRLSSFFGVIMCITSSILAGQTERGDDMFMTTLTRHCEQVLDLKAVDLLPEPVVEDMTPIVPPPEMEQRHEFGEEKDWNESWYFDFVDQEQGVAGWVRMGLVPNHNDNGSAWYHATLTREGKPTIIVSDFAAPLPDANLHLTTANIDATHQVVKPLETFHLTLRGKGYVLNPEDEGFFKEGDSINTPPPLTTDLELALTFESDGSPYKYRITTRYEIPCRISGTIKTVRNDDEDVETFSMHKVPGQRDHSYGVRDWWSMDWVWNSFHTDNGLKHFHATDLRLANTPRIGMGYVQRKPQADGGSDMFVALEIDKLSCDETKDPQTGLVTGMLITIKTHGQGKKGKEGDNEEEVVVKVTPRGHTPLKLPSPDGRVSFFDRAWGEVELLNTGEKGVGWFEWNCALDL